MIYRALDLNGDYTFGRAGGNFLVDSREAVAQAVQTRLKLIQGEFFLDITAGTPYNSEILGAGTIGKYDLAIKTVILGTAGVTGLTAYSSQVDPTTRKASVTCTITTKYGQTTLSQIL